MVKLVSAEDTWSLRQQILRPHQDLQASKYENDLSSETFHVGVFFEDGRLQSLVCVATFFPEGHPHFLNAKNPFRLRGMATDRSMQARGLGRLALEFSFLELKKRNCDLLWCNARESAFGFYEKVGFHLTGPMFDIAGIGPHRVMYKAV